jgi:hypothetical protein
MIKRIFFEPEGIPPGTEPPAATPPTTTDGGGTQPQQAYQDGPIDQALEIADEEPWKGWWASQVNKDVRDKHHEKLLALKEKQLGDVIDDYFTSKNSLIRAIIPPGENPSPEERKAFLKRMGIPETPEGYGLKPELIEDEDGSFTKNLAQRLHRMGLTRKQGAQVFSEYSALMKAGKNRLEQINQDYAATFEPRLTEYLGGEAKAKDTTEWFKRFVVSMKDKDLAKELADSGIMYSPRFVAAIATYHRANTQDPPLGMGSSSGKQERTARLQKSESFEAVYGKR